MMKNSIQNPSHIFKLRCNGESYGWTERLLHPYSYRTALQAQIELDKESNFTEVKHINLMAVGLGLIEKDRLIDLLSMYEENGIICRNALVYVLLDRWDDYWDIV